MFRLPAIPRTSNYDVGRIYGSLQISSNNDVLSISGSYYVWDPTVYLVSGTYYMVYSRWPNASGDTGYSTASEIALATASDPLGPFIHNTVLLTGTGGGAWDSTSVHNARLLQDGQNWRLYYIGYNGSGAVQIGAATAPSITGTYVRSNNNPVITTGTSGAWDDDFVNNPTVIKDDSTYMLWYKGGKSVGLPKIGLATANSYDGPFTKSASNPVVDLSPADLQDPTVWKENKSYWMMLADYTGIYVTQFSCMWLWSVDGVIWTQPEFGYKAYLNSWFVADRVERPSFLWINGKKKYMYVGKWKFSPTYVTISVAVLPD